MDTKTKPIYMLPTKDRSKDTQSKGEGMERYSIQSFHEVCKSHHYAVYLKFVEWYVSIIQSVKLEEKE